MTSTDVLAADLISILLPFTEPFQATATRFRNSLAGEEETFPRVCELHNTLDLLAASKSPVADLWGLRGGGGGGGGAGKRTPGGADANKDAEDLLSFMLHAEFVLFDLYKEYNLSLNPSLAHWVGICREFDKYARDHAESNAEWGLRERVLKIRAAFVKGILGDQGVKLANITPQDFAIRGLDFKVDLDSFREALHNQGIYGDDEQHSDEQQQQHEPEAFQEGPCSQTNNFVRLEKAPTPGTPNVRQEMQARVSSIIFQATAEELPSDLTDRLLSHLGSSPELLSSYPLDLVSSATIANLFSTNPVLTRGLVSLFLAHGDKAQRQEIINALEFLPITLSSLEMLNDLVTKTPLLNRDEIAHLVHGVLENGIHSAEAMGSTSTTISGRSTMLGDGYDIIANGGGSSLAGRQAQSRHIRLLCLFIQSLLRHDVVGLQDVYYQIQGIGVKFMFVKEARELWRAYCAADA